MIHAGKPEPQLSIPQAQTAHDSMWDWLSLTPESTHMIGWMLSDHTIPRSYRMMSGYGVHTFVLVNAEGKRTYCKFHWKPKFGQHGLVWDECIKLMGCDPDYHRRDLADAIMGGAFPEWELGLQLIPVEDEDKVDSFHIKLYYGGSGLTYHLFHQFDFDLLDATKLVPQDLYPVEVRCRGLQTFYTRCS